MAAIKEEYMNKRPGLLGVAGGKGGVGKTLIAAKLATQSAKQAKLTCVIDLDLTSPNLHSVLGVQKVGGSLSDFFTKKLPLERLITQTEHENLFLISGKNNDFFIEDFFETNTQKFIQALEELPFDNIILDFGAGSSQKLLDVFSVCDQRILVTKPDIYSVENFYHFIKRFILRSLMKDSLLNEFLPLAQKIFNQKTLHSDVSFNTLLAEICAISQEHCLAVQSLMKNIECDLVLNQLKSSYEKSLADVLIDNCHREWGLKLNYMGGVEFDSAWEDVQLQTSSKFQYLLSNNSESRMER